MLFYEPLYQKYRPQTFSDLVGQEPIVITLSNAVKTQRISHAYLFTGPRGTGKTSSARILAKSINCLKSDVPSVSPCGSCEACRTIVKGSSLDVIEIDAASNTGVDNIREIIEQAKFAPIQLRYKVYIIDECHMLSIAAFNALLKILEEPPQRVIFILATTDPQRVLPTVISRCQRFDYRRISNQSIVQHLDKIANKENINIELDALMLIAQISNGGLRDAESLLDQLSLFPEKINAEKVSDLVGLISEKDLLSLLQAIRSNNSKLIIELCRKLVNKGKEPLTILQNIAKFYLNLLIAKVSSECPDLTVISTKNWEELCIEAEYWETNRILKNQQKLRDSEVQLKNTTQPYLWIEIILLDLLQEPKEFSIDSKLCSKATGDDNSEKSKVNNSNIESEATSNIENVFESINDNPSTSINDINLEEIWSSIVKKLPPFLAGLIKEHGCLLNCEGRTATVGMSTSPLLELAKGKLSQIELAFQEVMGHQINVTFRVEAEPKSSQNLPCELNSNIPNDNLNNLEKNIIPNQKINNSEIVLNKNQEFPHSPEINVSVEVLDKPFKVPHLIEQSDNEIAQIAKRIATFFKGEIIYDNKSVNNNDTSRDSYIPDNEKEKIATKVHQGCQNKEEKRYDNDQQKQFILNEANNNKVDNKKLSQKILEKKIKGRPAITTEEDLDF
ncbi:MAG: DNA polymerase III, subunit gamma/tau [Candidatus Atelocyanobacterium thalassa isolate SIO64986]|uniref:DNA polymerase III subunit gamma/tau n=1 Tax=Candidatus Atelocyanobacterium thalassa isolate SIO64986 TaxID=1527444 RepID=A0A086CFW3_9CHRO|nr:MAG: DNA polymerase III, subunit gamma/tau [Candidatus Atelocyanobacterium thalassa isolate SIO64986]